ncbi:MAG: hypothetical protein QME69_02805 [Candidatus Saccharicenans sp.]|nr:hypothetical protein [Candidatus Saccharicenans sp.]
MRSQRTEKIESKQTRRQRLEAVKARLICALATVDWKLNTDAYNKMNHLDEFRVEELEAAVLKVKDLAKHLGE